ncbi:MAG: ribosome-associated translation inhibitor RaiA [Alphaproteobacteria bacterium]
MQIQVTGKHIDVGDALTNHMQDRLDTGITKYFDRSVDAHIVLSKEGPMFRADCSVHLASGISLQAQYEAGDVYASFDGAAERLEKRVRRYKRRLRNHHDKHKGQPLPAADADYFVLRGEDHAQTAEPETLDPVIIAESTKAIKTMSAGEAVMQLELHDSPALVFKNAGHGGVNVVYRREDGNIGWIDPPSS